MKFPNEIFYSLSNDGILEQFEDLLSALNSKSRFILSQESKSVSNFTYNNLNIECILYDGITNNPLTTILDWNISKIETKINGYNKTTASIKIEDSNGIEKNIGSRIFIVSKNDCLIF